VKAAPRQRCAGLAALLCVAACAALAPRAAAQTVPVFCARGAGIGFEQPFSCRRADTRTSFTSVPAGMHLHVMHLHATPNNASTSGAFAMLVGRDDGDEFPTFPSLDMNGGATTVNALRFRTPYVILNEGETLSVANFEHSDFPVDTYVSGFLSPVVRAPEPSSLGVSLAAGASLGALGAVRSRGARSPVA
jgi:hypothetical protein